MAAVYLFKAGGWGVFAQSRNFYRTASIKFCCNICSCDFAIYAAVYDFAGFPSPAKSKFIQGAGDSVKLKWKITS